MTRGAAYRSDRPAAIVAVVSLLHLLGWGLFSWYSRRDPALAGLGTLAYAFGLRHAFDADHIAAIDNTTRKLLRDGQRPVGVGLFFSLGHSAIVFVVVAGLAVAAGSTGAATRSLESYGGYIGPAVAATFLLVVAVLNSVVLADLLHGVGEMRDGRHDDEWLERRLLNRGVVNRLFVRGLGSRIRSSWQMFPVGALFGLSFDTATEVALLAAAAGVATHATPLLGVLSLPVLFAAGMSLIDTATGAFMRQAYAWGTGHSARRLVYNISVTGLSVAVALIVGTIELLQVVTKALGLDGGLWDGMRTLDLSHVGFGIVAVSSLVWIGAVVVWKATSPERRRRRSTGIAHRPPRG